MKIDGFLDILLKIESILLFDGVMISIGRKDLGNTDEIIGVLL